ncbi:MAG: tetratricopeptide repeat protein [Phycisphaerae bacterium]
MNRARHFGGPLAFWLGAMTAALAAFAAPQTGAEPPGPPPYVIIDGRPVPTVIVPPAREPQRPAPSREVRAASPPRETHATRNLWSPERNATRPRVIELGGGGRELRTADRVTVVQPGVTTDDTPRVYLTDRRTHAVWFDAIDPRAYQQALADAYWRGRDDAQSDAQRLARDEDRARRLERLGSAHQRSLDLGLEQLRIGDYSKAVIAFALAADLDQGDPSCRIHLAQARVALGHYDEAAETLRRALQLQPKLAYMDLRLASYLPSDAALGEQIDRLAARVREREASAELHFLLGYLRFQRGDYGAAHESFAAAGRTLRHDELTRTYLSITKPQRK